MRQINVPACSACEWIHIPTHARHTMCPQKPTPLTYMYACILLQAYAENQSFSRDAGNCAQVSLQDLYSCFCVSACALCMCARNCVQVNTYVLHAFVRVLWYACRNRAVLCLVSHVAHWKREPCQYAPTCLWVGACVRGCLRM